MDIYSQQGCNPPHLPMKRHELADYLNIPRPSLSREMASMRDEGVIDFSGSEIIVKKLPVLESYLE